MATIDISERRLNSCMKYPLMLVNNQILELQEGNMFIEQRKSLIVEELTANAVCPNNILIDAWVSQATIWDLTELERSGLLNGPMVEPCLPNLPRSEAGYADKENVKLKKKRSSQRVCSSMVNDGDTVMLDSKATTFEIAQKDSGRTKK